MYLIGVIANNKNILKFLRNKFDEKEANFIDLNLNVIENFKNIKFDIVLISDLENYTKSNNLEKILSSLEICVINADIKRNLEFLDVIRGIVVTYGFNPKSTITASSINDNNISICIQRVIETVDKKKIEPIEYVEVIDSKENIETSDIIGIKAIELLLSNKKI